MFKQKNVCSENIEQSGEDVLKEAQIQCRLKNNNIITLHDCFEELPPKGWLENKLKELFNIT